MESLKKNITVGDQILKNFINLNDKEKKMIMNWRNTDAVRKWSFTDHLISIEEHCNFIKKLEEDNKNFYWLVKNKNEYVGVVCLSRVDFKNKNAYLGIYSNPQLKAAGSLLIKCLKGIAFDIAQLHTLKLEVIEDNEKALNFYKKSGFKKEGKLKDYVFKNGKYENVIIMGITNKYGNKN